MHRGGDALPADAFPLPVSQVAEFQQQLDAHGRIRLDPAGDYRRASGIVIRSGQAIFGAAGTRMGRLVVAPGTSGTIVSGVVPDALEFPPSPLRTHDNCFERFAARYTSQAALTLRNVVLENNLFLDSGRVVIDTSRGGRVRNNRFIRTQVHGHSPALQLLGSGADSADRNVFLWINILSAPGEAIDIRGQGQVNLVGLDAENWNVRGLASRPAMLTTERTGTLRAFMPQGGDAKSVPGPFMDVEAQQFELIGLRLYRAAYPAIRVQNRTGRHVNAPVGGPYLAAQGESSAVPWEVPEFGAVADPAGPEWRIRRGMAPDDTARLQRMLDEQGIVRLPAGVFHISAPLRLRSGHGIVGAGAGRTAIVARTDDIDLIVGEEHLDEPSRSSLVLVDLTLQGGRAGIRHDARGSGPGAQYVHSFISHVVFRDMTQAGILVDGIYGWDNNLLDEVTFHRLPVGIMQLPNPAYISAEVSGNVPGTNYLDKNVCYRCRFEQVETGLWLVAKRANNLNACVSCRFITFSSTAIRLKHSGNTIIANSDFIGAGGRPVIESDLPVGLVSSRFLVDGRSFGAPAGMPAPPPGLLVDWAE